MRFPIWLTLIAAAATLALVLAIGVLALQPPRPLLVSASFSHERISPNADGVDDVAEFQYEVTRNAFVTLTFTNADGVEFIFRDAERRIAEQYALLFSGVVDGFVLPGETVAGEVVRRLLPDGVYTWTLRAVAQDDGEIMEKTGTLEIVDADDALPDITTFEIGPQEFTPNQDGINDRTWINVFVTKEADLSVFMIGADGERVFIARREEGHQIGEAGLHAFDYEGGIDIDADPPPDGTYTVVAEARDAVGQIVRQSGQLTIRDGGKPRAEIMGQPTGVDVVFEVMPYDERFFSSTDGLGDRVPVPSDPASLARTTINVPQGDLLVFRLTVQNYGPTPIRTTGPPPGTVYQQTQRAASMGEFDQSGAWRVGIDCETEIVDYPWRWAIGDENNLTHWTDPVTGNTYYYLPPGEQSVVWGAIRMTEVIEARNPQDCWAGLIHEDVAVSLQNSNRGRREVGIVPSSALTADN